MLLSDFSSKEIEVTIQTVESSRVFEDNYVDLSKVINFIVRNKVDEGSHETLCSKLSLKLRRKGLQILLTKNKDFLKDSFIKYEILPRTNKARLMRLAYEGDEET